VWSYQKISKLNRKLKSKKTKTQVASSSSSSNEEDNDTSSNESYQPKKGKERKKKWSKPSYNTTTLNYDSLPSNHAFTSMHVDKPPHFDRTNYAKWCHALKVHLMSLNLSIWKAVFTCVNFLKDGETPYYNQLQQIHYNA
jgi:hypothetical protein